ncbi:MAG: hypothetical protein O2794_03975 [bacterium]|nr:hypothetical protein [bacterium]
MKITELKIYHLEIPLRVSFSHSSATRRKTDSIIVCIESVNGNVGYGEGCPRSYVTGEDWKSAKVFFDTIQNKVKGIGSYEDLLSWVKSNENEINKNPAAWCAIELAVLDLLGKENKESIEEVLGLPVLTGEFSYTAVIGTRRMVSFCIQALIYKLKGFNNFKVKIFGDGRRDKRKIAFLRMIISRGLKLRIDANNLWADTVKATSSLKDLGYRFLGIEEPITANQYQALTEISKEIDASIILDESFLRMNQFQNLESNHAKWIINVRVSKMGGLIRSIEVCKEAQKRKIPIIVGAQVGETSILTHAALSLANAFRGNLLAQEGAFGTYLLEKDITEPSIRFGQGGIVKATDVTGDNKYGFGLSIKMPNGLN